jgi:hypothetical protein
MKDYDWNEDKNQWLKVNRDISFEEIVYFVENNCLLDDVEHPNKAKYPRQRMFIVKGDTYTYLVPYVEEETYYFLKTIIPSSTAKKKYTEQNNEQ